MMIIQGSLFTVGNTVFKLIDSMLYSSDRGIVEVVGKVSSEEDNDPANWSKRGNIIEHFKYINGSRKCLPYDGEEYNA